MAATELQNRSSGATETNARELREKVAEQVSEILEEAAERELVPVRVRQRELAYRIPSPGVRYYF